MSELVKPKKFTIERERWLRGEGGDASRLLRLTDGKMCCVGFYALACQIETRAVEEHRSWMWGEKEFMPHYRAATLLYEPNDDENWSDVEREATIKNGFATIGVEVEFVD